MGPDDLAAGLRALLPHATLSPELPIEAELIANPKAGGFTRLRFAKARRRELEAVLARARNLPTRTGAVGFRVHLTARGGHATDLAHSIFAEARASGYPPALRILMTAGGDGTSLETLEALISLPEEERSRWIMLRLPMGTGNDGSDGRNLDASLNRLIGDGGVEDRRAVLCVPNPEGGKKPSWSFNIASVGLDAFVTRMTNRLKTAFPGDSYKLWVDLATVLYERFYAVEPLEVRALGPGDKELSRFTKPCLLLAFGASGNRQYGSNKPILPDENNVCAIFQMSFLKKLILKGPIAAGKHRGIPEAALFSAEAVELRYGARILMQRDGEDSELEPGDFPFRFSLSKETYRVLSVRR